MKSLSVDFFINIVLLLISIFLIMLASEYPAMARHFPQLVLVMIIVVTVLDIINGIRVKASAQETDKDQKMETTTGSHRGKVAYMVFLMFVFYAFLRLFGLPVGVFVFLLFSAWTLGYKRMKVLALSSLAFTAFVYVIFVVIMQSLLPNGVIFDLFRG